MTNAFSFIVGFKERLDEADWPWVIAALRENNAVWRSLEKPGFAQKALRTFSSQTENWTPGNLALLALEHPYPFDSLSIDKDLRGKAIVFYRSLVENTADYIQQNFSLEQAGLVAIALLERRKRVGSWQGLPDELPPLSTRLWRAPLACLYGLSPDPQDLLKAWLSNGSSPAVINLTLHAFLSNPLPADQQLEALKAFLQTQELPEATHLLRSLEVKRPILASRLAEDYLESQPKFSLPANANTTTGRLFQITQLLYQADLQAIAGNVSEAKELRSLALDNTTHLHQGFASLLAEDAARRGDTQSALEAWQDRHHPDFNRGLKESHPLPPAGLLLGLLEERRSDDALQLLEGSDTGISPFHTFIQQLALAQQSTIRGEISLAQGYAKTALQIAREAFTTDSFGTVNIIVGESDPIGSSSSTPAAKREDLDANQDPRDIAGFLGLLAHLLFDIELPNDSLQVCEVGLSLQPNDIKLLIGFGKAQMAAGRFDAATQTAHLAVALDPNRAELRRFLIDCLEASQDWEAALEEWENLIDARFRNNGEVDWPESADLVRLAFTAVQADNPLRAIEASHVLLGRDPKDGLAHTAIGKAHCLVGEYSDALEHLHSAIQFAPDAPQAWLALSEAFLTAEQPQKAIDTLRKAANAVPGDPTIQLALAENYLREEAFTQALTTLHHAYELTKQNDSSGLAPYSRYVLRIEIGMKLAKTLRYLGRLEEARAALEDIYNTQPTYPGVAYNYAEILLAQKEVSAALEPLTTAAAEEPENPQICMDYANALLRSIPERFKFGINHTPAELIKDSPKPPELISAEVIEQLNHVLELDSGENAPLRAQALALLGEAHEIGGNTKAAMEYYFRALETTLSDDPNWSARLSFGLGRVALRESQPETAIAALQEAARHEPNNPQVQRTLAEAYLATRLDEEALHAAHTAVKLAGDDPDITLWFAAQALNVGSMEDASLALSKALKFAPENADYLLELGQLAARCGEVASAKQAYVRVRDLPEADEHVLTKAAKGLLSIDEPAVATACFERALEVNPEPSPEILGELAEAYSRAGSFERALEFVDQALTLNPKDAQKKLLKAEWLLKTNKQPQALQTLEESLEQHPDFVRGHYLIAQILRADGQLKRALEHTESIVNRSGELPESEKERVQVIAAHSLAAELARALLQPEYAQELLQIYAYDRPVLVLPFHSLNAEFALDRDAEIAAAGALTSAFDITPDHPRVLALQARLTNRRGELPTALQSLKSALEILSKTEDTSTNGGDIYAKVQLVHDLLPSLLSVSEAAVELAQWDVALYLLHRAADLAPQEPFVHLQIARSLVLRAEYQRMCAAVEAINHAPGETAVSEHAFENFEAALQEAERLLAENEFVPQEGQNQLIERWHARGLGVFRPGPEATAALNALQGNKTDFAARIAALRQTGDMATIVQIAKQSLNGNSKPNAKQSQAAAQLALSLGAQGRREEDLLKAVEAATQAIKGDPNQPIYHALFAQLAFRLSAEVAENPEDHINSAANAIQTALASWADEPRWHVLAARLHLAAGDPNTAIEYWEHATELEPLHSAHWMELGNTYLQIGAVSQATRAFERAQLNAPDEVQPHMALAEALMLQGEFDQAALSAEKAKKLAPEQPDSYKLLGKIALQAGKPAAAQKHIEGSLEFEPQDAQALSLLAEAYERMEQKSEAVEVLEKAIPLTEEPLSLMLKQAELLADTQGPGASLDKLQSLAEEYPYEPAVLTPLALAFASTGQREAAIQTAQRALRSHHGETHFPEEQEDRSRAQAHLLLGKLLRQTGQLDQAIHQLSESIRLDQEQIEAYLELGNAQKERRQQAVALATYQKAIAVAPHDPRPYYQAGLTLKESRDYLGAESMLRRASKLAPEDLNIHRQLGALVALNLVHNRKPVH